MSYEELREVLIEKGADAKLFDMPAIRERLEKESISPDDIVVNFDGTFNFGKYVVEKKKIEKVVEEPTVEQTQHFKSNNTALDAPFSIDEDSGVISTKKTVQQDKVLTIVECGETSISSNVALDAPFSMDENYQKSYKGLKAKLTIVDTDGIEIETQEIENSQFLERETQKGKLSYRTFDERNDLVSTRTTRDNGMVIETDSTGRKTEFYDDGKWNLTLNGRASIGTQEGSRPTVAMSVYDTNSQKLIKKYPQLQSSVERRKQSLMKQIDTRTLSLMSDNLTLEGNNEKLQKMLQKALTFAQTVRDSRVGKIFFGKKAKEVLGEQDKDAKQLPEGR